eukprot:2228875-Ditylum_brightwellii.AAC.1
MFNAATFSLGVHLIQSPLMLSSSINIKSMDSKSPLGACLGHPCSSYAFCTRTWRMKQMPDVQWN